MVQLLFLVVVGYSPGSHAPGRRSSVSFCSACRSRQDERGLLKTMGSGPLSCSGVVPHHHRGQMLRHPPAPCNRPGLPAPWRPLHGTADCGTRIHPSSGATADVPSSARRVCVPAKTQSPSVVRGCSTAVVVPGCSAGCSARGGQLLPDSPAASGCGATAAHAPGRRRNPRGPAGQPVRPPYLPPSRPP